MKIGLVRHFKVLASKSNKRLNSDEFNVVMKNYDLSPVEAIDVNINSNDWDVCYASTLSRAVETAKTVCHGEIISTDLLVEVPLKAFMKTEFSISSIVWHVGGRIAWLLSSKSQIENILDTKRRIVDFINIIEKSEYENILVVSHGFFMKVFVHHLKKRGFIGNIDFAPKNGKLYLFEK